MYVHVYICIYTYIYVCVIYVYMYPPKYGEIALLLATDGLLCCKCVSQKPNEAIDNCQGYKMLLNFIL